MSDDPLPAALMGLGGGLYLFYKGFRELRLEREISGLAMSKVRSMAMGTVELAGRAGVHTPLMDPVHGQSCCYFNVSVEEKRGSGRDETWVTIYQKASDGTPFLLMDETGSTLVYPEGATLYLDYAVNVTRNGVGRLFATGPSNDPVERFVSTLSCSSSATLRIQLRVLRQDQSVYVLGFAAPDKEAPPGGPAPPIAVRKNPDGDFVISDETEERLVSSLTHGAAWKIILGPVLTIACAAYLAHRMGFF